MINSITSFHKQNNQPRKILFRLFTGTYSIIFLLFTLMLFSPLVSLAQNNKIEALEKEAEKASDERQLEIFFELFDLHLDNDPGQALFYGKEALTVARMLKWKNEMAMANSYIGEVYLNMEEHSKAIEYLVDAELLYRETENQEGLAHVSKNLGRLHLYLKDYIRALNFLEYAYRSYQTTENKLGFAQTNLLLGEYYSVNRTYEKAIKYYTEALFIGKENESRMTQYWSYKNLGIIYDIRNEHKKSLDYYTEALNLIVDKEDKTSKFEVPFVLNAFGSIYLKLGDTEMAIYYYNKALSASQENYQSHWIANIKLNLGLVYKKREDIDKALEFFNESRTLAWQRGFLGIQKENLFNISDIYLSNMDYRGALDFYKQYVILSDSLYSIENHRQTKKIVVSAKYAEMETRKELEKRQIELNKYIYKAERNEKLIYVCLGLVALVISMGFYMRKNAISKYEQKLRGKDNSLQNANINIEDKIKERSRKLQNELVVRKQVEVQLLIDKKKAEEMNRLKSAFISNVSHDLRTPLNAIMGFSSLLKDNNLSPGSQKEYIEHINFSSNVMYNLLDQIIDISKIESNTLNIRNGEFYINKALDALKTTFEHEKMAMGKGNIKLNVVKSFKNDDFVIETDGFRVQQVLSNLIRNGLTFTDKGSIEFGYRFGLNNMLEFFVKDTGIGIVEWKVKAMFDRFEQIHHDKSKIYSEEGLGLPISMNIVDLLGGTIKVESTPGEGSVFYFTIPYKPFEKKGGLKAPKDLKQLQFNWSGKTILIAEDTDSNYHFLEAALNKSQAILVRAHNGEEAVEICKTQNIDLVLMDLQMPKLDGYEATKQIKSIKKQLPIIAQTAFAMANERIQSIEAGCDDYISKPIKEKTLFEKIAHFLA